MHHIHSQIRNFIHARANPYHKLKARLYKIKDFDAKSAKTSNPKSKKRLRILQAKTYALNHNTTQIHLNVRQRPMRSAVLS